MRAISIQTRDAAARRTVDGGEAATDDGLPVWLQREGIHSATLQH